MTSTTAVRVARTAEEFDALPDSTIVLNIQRSGAGDREHRIRTLFQKVSRHWLELDPTDQYDGEQTRPSGYLANHLTGFGSYSAIPGVALILNPLRELTVPEAAALPPRSIILAGEAGHWGAAVFTHEGGGRWAHMDPSDRDNGDYTVPTEHLSVYGDPISLLYAPGDEDVQL